MKTARITDDDLKIRHTTVHLLLVALGYVSDDSSKGTIMEVQERVKKAVERGDMVIDSPGIASSSPAIMRRHVARELHDVPNDSPSRNCCAPATLYSGSAHGSYDIGTYTFGVGM